MTPFRRDVPFVGAADGAASQRCTYRNAKGSDDAAFAGTSTSMAMDETSRYDVTVSTKVTYIEDQSDPSQNDYVFAYTITVTNTGSVPAQLVSRHWVITDANNKVLEVKGLGVIGQQPMLKPGESFEYTSGTHLETAVGTMRGTYQMVADDGQHFDAAIAPFTLSVPRVLH
jgi:ApaG protein